MATKPRIYLAVTGPFGADIVCGAFDPQRGDQISAHVCSDRSRMWHDLIERKPDVVAELQRRYPDGHEVIEVAEGDELPPPVEGQTR